MRGNGLALGSVFCYEVTSPAVPVACRQLPSIGGATVWLPIGFWHLWTCFSGKATAIWEAKAGRLSQRVDNRWDDCRKSTASGEGPSLLQL